LNVRQSETMQKVIINNGKVVSVSGSRPNIGVIADLSESSNSGNTNNQMITKTDSKTNIKLEAQSGVVPDNTTVDVTEIKSGETFDKIKNILSEIKNFKVFDITLKSDGTNIQPNGKVKISIPIPVGFDASRLIVYRLDENNTKTEYQVTVTNGYATFETDHFSTYALGEKIKDNYDAKLPQTGEEPNAFAEFLSTAIFLGTFWLVTMLLIDRKKKKMTER